MLIVYHADCWDGFCCAWLLHKAYPDARFVPANYGSKFPGFEARENVIIADFSYDYEIMKFFAEFSSSTLVFDHHKTAKETLDRLEGVGNMLINFDLNKSGARLVFDWMHTQRLLLGLNVEYGSWIVDYTEDRDLWNWKLNMSREVNASLRSYDLNFDKWDELEDRSVESMALEGIAILRAESKIVDSHCQHVVKCWIGGYEVPCVNATTLISEIGNKLSIDYPFAATYFDSNKGTRVWSLRSQEDGIDVSEIAKKYGGGGHKHAAGFTTSISHYMQPCDGGNVLDIPRKQDF